MEIIELFETLVKIPSPSMQEENLARKVTEILENAGVEVERDNCGNLIARISGTNKDKLPLILSAHMDVIGDSSPINLVYNGEFIETDKKRTLGADDKAGVACAIKLALDIKAGLEIDHGGLEIVLTKDEEHSMTGIHNLDFKSLKGEDILVMDSDKLGNFEISGAGYTKLTLSIKTPKGGHSGIDIADKTRLNAAKLIAELINEIPQGVYKENELGVITSINLGSIVAGGVDNSIYETVQNKIERTNAAEYACFNSMSNLINTKAFANYSIRSSDENFEHALINEIKNTVALFNEKYKNLAIAEIKTEEHLPIFKKSENEKANEIARHAALKIGMEIKIQSFHAGAETHIYAHEKNAQGTPFRPVLVGVADIYNMHSPYEKINAKSLKQGYAFIKEFFKEYNK